MVKIAFPPRRVAAALFGAGTLALVGCTNALKVEPVVAEAEPWKPHEGVPYFLPETELLADLLVVITACDVDKGVLKLGATAQAKLSAKRVAETSRPYLVDIRSLASPIHKSAVKVHLNTDGTLKMIDGTGATKIPEITVELAKTARSIATFAATGGFGPPLGGAAPDLRQTAARKQALCGEMDKAIASRKKAEARIKQQQKLITQIEARLHRATDKDLERLNRAVAARVEAEGDRAKALARSSLTLKKGWRPTPAKPSITFAPTQKQLQRLALDLAEPAVEDAVRKLAFRACVLPSGEQGGCAAAAPGNGAPASGHATEGTTDIVVRVPASKRVVIERVDGDQPLETVFAEPQRLAQFGQTYTLPFQVDAFDNNMLVAKFDDDGGLKEVSYTSEASALAMAQTLSTASGALLGTRQDIRAEEAAIANAGNAALQAEIDRLTLERKLEALRREIAAEQADADG